MKKTYKPSIWSCLPIPFFCILVGIGGMVVTFGEEGMKAWIIFYILGPMIIIVGFLFFQGLRNTTIIVEDEFISKNEELKIGTKKLGKSEVIQIRWEDIIAIYMVKIPWPYESGEKRLLIFPKGDTGDRKHDDVINFKVKTDKRSKETKAYAHWLVTHKKGIIIPKGIKNCDDLLKKIHKKAPQAVIDNEIRRLIEKNEKKNKKAI